MRKLNPKQIRFTQEYLIDLNATQAAIRAGYSPKTAGVQAHELLKKLNIQEFIQIGADKRGKECEINAAWVLRQAVKLHERCMGTGRNFHPAGAAKGLEMVGKHINIQAFLGTREQPLSPDTPDPKDVDAIIADAEKRAAQGASGTRH